MTAQLATSPYSAWLEHVFGHEVRPFAAAWYFDLDAPRDDAAPAEILNYMTRLFEAPETALEYFADDQIAQGLYYLIAPGASDYMHYLYDIRLSAALRARCFTSMFTIFERILAPRCTPVLAHIDEPGAAPLNGVCYMWWDILATSVGADDPGRIEINAAILATLAHTLELPSIACQEAALHGLGHSTRGTTANVAALIDAYLQRETTLRTELARYARAARGGCVQ